jgi:hypothetical protein
MDAIRPWLLGLKKRMHGSTARLEQIYRRLRDKESRSTGDDAHLQSMTVGTRRIKPGLGRTTTATWEVPDTARSFLVGFRDREVMSN